VVNAWIGARYTLQNGGSVLTLVFGGDLFHAVSVEVWMWIHPGTDDVSSGDDVGCSHELKSSHGAKLR
jgi:hypothetical protein